MDVDPQLPLFAQPPDSPNVAFLVRLLKDAKVWLTASQISQRVDGHWSDRQIRSLAEAACPAVISGQRGYRHVSHASPEEIHHFVAWMESQAKKMLRRAFRVRRRAHQVFG